MLKLIGCAELLLLVVSAAFGRLCVETNAMVSWLARILSAAFGRLCVETFSAA